MPRNPLTFRPRDVTAAIKAVERAGYKVARIRIGQDGSIVVDLAPPAGNQTAPRLDLNEWDEDPLYGKAGEPNPWDRFLKK